ncbi:protein tyrosine/serine phosphatase [Leifsonia sp. EB34]
MAEHSGEAAAAAYAPLLGVQRSFLDASYSAVAEHYGSVDAYLTEGLGLSAQTIATLRTKLTA